MFIGSVLTRSDFDRLFASFSLCSDPLWWIPILANDELVLGFFQHGNIFFSNKMFNLWCRLYFIEDSYINKM
jgi:hypothetical protein